MQRCKIRQRNRAARLLLRGSKGMESLVNKAQGYKRRHLDFVSDGLQQGLRRCHVWGQLQIRPTSTVIAIQTDTRITHSGFRWDAKNTNHEYSENTHRRYRAIHRGACWMRTRGCRECSAASSGIRTRTFGSPKSEPHCRVQAKDM